MMTTATRRTLPAALLALLLAAAAGPASAADYLFTGRRSTPGRETTCSLKDNKGNPLPFCKVCGGLTAVLDACDASPDCAAADMEGVDCGYLKSSASGTVFTEGFSQFCKAGAPGCTGTFQVKRRGYIIRNALDCRSSDEYYCRVPGDASRGADACLASPDCKAFDMQDTPFSFLKNATGPRDYSEFWNSFIKL